MNKKIGNNQFFYLRDFNFKFFDLSFYYYYKDSSDAQKYIYDFKKDFVKPYNTYFNKPSELIFEFFERVYQKILLNKNNLEFIYKIIVNLSLNGKNNKNIFSIKYVMLPVILKYLSIFGCINTKTFVIFKIKNEDIINKIIQALSDTISEKNKSNNSDFEENINEVINQLNSFKIIYNNIKCDLSKLNEYDYNFGAYEEFDEKNSSKNIIKLNNLEKKNDKLKNIKSILKNKMKNKNTKILEKMKNDEEMINEINQKELEENFNEPNETICSICRNNIFDEPYGKGGYLFSDYFYSNSLNSSINSEFKEVLKKQFYEKDYIKNKTLSTKIISCGHYFHFSCFITQNENSFSCPLCLKNVNILIPPLNYFHNIYNYLKSYTIDSLFNEKEEEIEIINYGIFGGIINNFLSYILNYSENDDIIQKIVPTFKSNLNYLENLFYYKASNFHKSQQIKINQNFILSIRFIAKIDIINVDDIINIIVEKLSLLVKGPTKEDNILKNYESMYYIDILETILLYLAILFDYDEIKEILLYLVYIFLPYFIFGFYLKELINNSKLFPCFYDTILETMNFNNLVIYVESHNELVTDCLKLFLQKLCLIKFITDYNEIEDNILNDFNELNIAEYLSLVEIDNFNFKNKVKPINMKNNLGILFKSVNISKILNGKIGNEFDPIKIFKLLINNIQNITTKEYLIKSELIPQFSPKKFLFVKLKENLFDFVEKYLEKKCIICSKISRFFYICLICGKKICHTSKCNNYYYHTLNCGGKYCIFINFKNEKALIAGQITKEYSSLYINKQGVGPSSKKISNEFKLDKEKVEQYFRNFISYDFHFN